MADVDATVAANVLPAPGASDSIERRSSGAAPCHRAPLTNAPSDLVAHPQQAVPAHVQSSAVPASDCVLGMPVGLPQVRASYHLLILAPRHRRVIIFIVEAEKGAARCSSRFAFPTVADTEEQAKHIQQAAQS